MSERVELEKTLSPFNVGALALGSIIGFGCFILPSDLMAKSGPLGAAIGIFLGAIIMIIIGRCYGFMVREVPVSGGEFAYAYTGFGRNHAYLCGWFLTLGYLSIVPLNATALALLAKFIAPGLFEQGYLYTMAGYDVYAGEIALASAAIIIFGYFNYRGVKDVGKVQLLMVGLLLGAVALIGGGTALNPDTSVANLLPPFAQDKGMIASILAILAISPWLYVGFDTIPQAAEEYDFPPEKGFKLIFWSIFLGAVMYVIVLLSTGMVFPWTELVAGKHNWATGYAMEHALGKSGVIFLVVGISMAICTGINGFYMATSRLLFGMARAKILPKWFVNVHETHKTPSNAILFIMLFSLLAPWFGRQVIVWVVDMAALGTTFGYAYTCFGCYIMAKNSTTITAQESSTNKAWGLVGGAFSIGFLLLLCVPGSPGFMATQSWIALVGWVALGIVFYLSQTKEYNKLTKAELDYLILGTEKPVSQ
ncbi:amino acid/polyamine/organocation transporter, APC superfamily [Desulfonispora thiosulfatigenes DSM 11270]|uniref:Amino acid/polyamine/organocation transporter, APC superfamily n=1 Tax=Desulfonispora thiosulfatigenes DSM 11270 TaxID=656914 RepID=A0A1W1UVV2_DESTI|nr:APC family permease [Desulfonispora thiosulfatigenes]SMB85285.1 amino acid/polyamine/organocation transporter, APC superfamily [Desulfonispora thiosulfatigenes DSM 11270]